MKKYGFLLEILIGVCLLIFINLMWSGESLGFAGVSPNPYWIVVIFIAARYGSLQGFSAGVICSLALLGSVSYGLFSNTEFDLGLMPYKVIQLCALFVLVGFLIGEERSRVSRILSNGRDQYNKLRNEFESLAMEHMALKDINTELEGRILGQADTMNTVYEVARDLVTLKIERLYPSVVELVKKFVGPEKCSFYVWENDQYLLKGHSGWGDNIRGREVLDISSDIIKKVMDEKKVVTVSDIFKEENLRWEEGKEPVMVAPLFFGEKDIVTGFILIDEISFLKLNPTSIRFLSVMADWISKAFDNAIASTTIRKKDIYDDELEVFNYNYAMRRMNEEVINAKISDKPSSVIVIKVKDFDKIGESRKKDVLKSTGFVIKNTLRGGDIIAKHSDEDKFLAILSGSDMKGSRIAAERITEQFKKFGLKPYGDDRKLDLSILAHTIDPKYSSEAEIFSTEGTVLN